MIRIDAETGCHEWQGSLKASRYGPQHGFFYYHGRQGYAHRYAYERVHGSIPKTHQINHICRNKKCVNLEHLECLTVAEHAKRDRDLRVSANKRSAPKRAAFSVGAPRKSRKNGLPTGVNKARGRYTAQIQFQKRKKHLGVFGNANEASEAYQRAVREHREKEVHAWQS